MKTVFFDVDTQLDFLYPAGALYIPGAEEIVPVFGELTKIAMRMGALIISDTDAHAEDDAEFRIWKPHCVSGTAGQHKTSETLTGQYVRLGTDPDALNAIRQRIQDAPQIILEKQQLDCFTNPHLQELLHERKAERYFVYGVVSEICVQYAAFGLLQTGARVELVTDAIRSLNADDERRMIQEFQTSGGVLTNVAAIRAEANVQR